MSTIMILSNEKSFYRGGLISDALLTVVTDDGGWSPFTRHKFHSSLTNTSPMTGRDAVSLVPLFLNQDRIFEVCELFDFRFEVPPYL